MYQPTFEIPQLRQLIAATDRRPYDAITEDVISPELLITFVHQGWVCGGQLIALLQPPISWVLPSRSHTFHLNAWEPISQLLAGFDRFRQRRYFETAYCAVLDWISQHQEPAFEIKTYEQLDLLLGQREDFVWYDMGVGLRCYRIAYLLDMAARDPAVPDNEIRQLILALYFHNEALSRQKFFRGHNNHGIYQALGQLAAAKRFIYLPEMSEYASLAASRLNRLVADHVFRSGVHKEHSPGYHYLVSRSLIAAKQAGLVTDGTFLNVLDAMEQVLSWMIMPDGKLAPIGDTDPETVRHSNRSSIPFSDPHLVYLVSNGRFGTSPLSGVVAFMDAGYAFARVPSRPHQPLHEWTYLAQVAGFHSRTHKHADHLSFIWHDRGRLVLTDAGRYEYLGRTDPNSALAQDGFWYSDPKRIFVESTCAHNTVQIDGRNFPRVGVEPFGSALVQAGERNGLIITECRARYFDTVRHRRILVLRPGEFLMIIDLLHDRDQQPHDFIQRFTFAPAWELKPEDNGWAAHHHEVSEISLRIRDVLSVCEALPVARGQQEPGLLGWCSDDAGSFVPASSIAYRQTGHPALFATLFAFGKELVIDAEQQHISNMLADTSFSWKCDDRLFDLKVSDEDGRVVVACRSRRST